MEGSLVSNGPLTVTITRSQSGLSDEFCCAGQCTAGNGQATETLSFTPTGLASWYVHYNPSPDSDVQVTYLFSDNTSSLFLRVRYLSQPQGLTNAKTNVKPLKILRNGQVQIRHADNLFNLQGTKINQ